MYVWKNDINNQIGRSSKCACVNTEENEEVTPLRMKNKVSCIIYVISSISDFSHRVVSTAFTPSLFFLSPSRLAER